MDARRLLHLLRWPLPAIVLVAALGVVPLWAAALYGRYVPRRVTLVGLIGVLEGIRFLFLLAVAIVPLGLACSLGLIVRERRRGRRTSVNAMRALLAGGSTLLGLLLLEAAAAGWLAWSHRPPNLPTRFAEGGPDDGQIDLLVVGESSALGVPYNPKLSMGQILAWQLGEVFPDRGVRVEMRAAVGLTLEGAIRKLEGLERRPDVVLVYSGHNEYHGRYGWDREVPHYVDEITGKPWRTFVGAANRASSLAALVQEHADRFRAELSPPARITRQLVGRPVVTPEEDAAIVADFRRRLEFLVRYCERIGAVPILVIPPGNEADHPPERSYLRPDTPKAERDAFARDFQDALTREVGGEPWMLRVFGKLRDRHPEFAEAQYRLARRMLDPARPGEAGDLFRAARDLDGLPMRCPSRIQRIYRTIARRHGSVVLIDGPSVLERLSPDARLGDALFHDAQHPNFRSYVALAQAALDRLKARSAFGWPEDRPAPVIDPAACAEHFGLDAEAWADACDHSAAMYRATAYIRHDPAPNLAKAALHEQAARRIRAGEAPEDVGVPGLGVWPAALPRNAIPPRSRSGE